MKLAAVDIGGTFIDCFVVWDGRYVQTKALTTHHNLSLGFNEALDEAAAELSLSRGDFFRQVESIRYATTLGTNALIERRGPRVGILTTEGFESTVPLSRGRGYAEGLTQAEALDLTRAKRPLPLVPPGLIRGIRQRLDFRGEEILPLDEEDVRLKLRELMDQGIQVLVVSLANSTSNDRHERRIREIFREEYPPHLLGSIPLILASEVAGRRGEYVRTSSAIIDAYLHSIMYFGLSSLELNLKKSGYSRPALVVHNTGGMAQLNSTDALRTVHSGPVAGIHAGDELARQSKLGNVVCTDMGGTSFDIGIVVEGGIKHYDFYPVIDRWLVTVPMVHLNSLGAGGGSIARYDPIYKTIAVGPESAGSEPGPACFDRGGLRPTVTDADMLLGYLDPQHYAHGKIKLNAARSRQALEDLCDELEMDAIAVAMRIRHRADSDMANGMVAELRARGYRVDDFTMLAYGGNGPLHCCGIARNAGIRSVLVPPFSPMFSACGAASLSPMHIHEYSQITDLYNPATASLLSDFERFNKVVEELESRGLKDLLRQGFTAGEIRHRLEIDIRYGSQKVETAVVCEKNRLTCVGEVLELIERLAVDHAGRYGEGAQAPESGIRIMAYRVASYVPGRNVEFGDLWQDIVKAWTPEPVGIRKCHFNADQGAAQVPLQVPCYDARALEAGAVLVGPAIINPGWTTYLVEPGWRFEAARHGAARLTRID
jgi:N-methylhydantoinase A